MQNNPKEFLWSQKYRPQKIKDCILPKHIKKIFNQFLKQGEIQNLLLNGPPGIGKTTIAKILCEEMDCDYILINGSLEGRNIDTLRTTIYGFASTLSLQSSKFKVIIIDESDFLNPASVQPGLRSFMEEFSKNCRFIFTANFKNKLLEPIRSRCTEVFFSIPNAEKEAIAISLFKRLQNILKNENIKFDNEVLSKIILGNFPDFRKCINDIQKFSIDGQLSIEVLNSCNIEILLSHIKNKDFKNMRKWVGENGDQDSSILMREVYDKLESIMKRENIPEAGIILAKYDYQSSFVVNQDINLSSFFVELMTLI